MLSIEQTMRAKRIQTIRLESYRRIYPYDWTNRTTVRVTIRRLPSEIGNDR